MKKLIVICLLFMLMGCNPEKEEIVGNKITFVTYSEKLNESVGAIDGEMVTEPIDPTRDGYTFMGWFLDDSYGNIFDFNSSVYGDLSLYAYWQINTYEITYLDMDGTVLHSFEVEYGEQLNDVQYTAVTGYTFLGWDISVPNTMPSKDLTITATLEMVDLKELDHISNFENIENQTEGTYLVYYYSEYCSHCIAIKDQVIKFSLSNTLGMKIYFLDATNTEGTRSLGLSGTPTIVVIEDNQFVELIVGSTNIPAYLEGLE